MTKIVLFGDESLIDSCLPVLEKLDISPVIVFDPKRLAANEFFNSPAMRDKYEIVPHPDKRERRAFVDFVAGWKVNLGLIVSYSRILWPELIEIFPYGVANVHCGKLPEFRGANILQWTIIHGAREGAVTLHYIDEGIDSGPVIDSISIPLTEDDTALTLRSKCLAEIPRILSSYLPAMLKGKVPSTEQEAGRAVVWPRRYPADSEIDWTWSNVKIRNLTRALVAPWPRAFYFDRNGLKHEVDGVLSFEEIRQLRKELGQ